MAYISFAKRCLSRNLPLINHHRASATSIVNEQLSGLRRWQSNDNSKPPFDIHQDNPFDILGIPKTSTYDAVKRRFLELALETHPDVVHRKQSTEDGGEDDAKERKRLVADFVKLRQAFETIRENSDGSARLTGDSEASSWSDESFQAWFHNETGHSDVMFTMDLQTRKEVAEVASLSQGGLDKGGMWEMARSMADQQRNIGNLKQKHFGNQTQRVEAGDSDEGNNRRRRRRK